MKRNVNQAKRPYLKQKLNLYFDENFPKEIVESLKSDKGWKRKCRVYSVYDFGNENRDDAFQFAFCKDKGYTLVTLDDDFWNDTTYPFGSIPGVIRVVADGRDLDKIKTCLNVLLSFLINLPLPKYFIGDTKFQVSEERCIIKGKDAQTGEVKTRTVVAGDTTFDVAKAFHYFYP